MKSKLSGMILVTAMLVTFSSAVSAAPIFFSDRASFLGAMSGPVTVDFEGICGANQWCTPEGGAFTFNGNTTSVGGIDFSVSSGTIGVSDPNGPVAGGPYNSSLLFSNNDRAISGDVTGLGPITALGAWFGDISGSSTTELTLYGAGGSLLDTQIVTAGDMGLGSPETFYGWIVTGGDIITGFTHSTFGGNSAFEGIDDLIYGRAGGDVRPVPEPSTLALFGLGLAAIGFSRRRRTS